MKVLIVQSAVFSESHHILLLYHQVNHTCIFPDYLRLEAMFLVTGFTLLIELPEIILFKSYQHFIPYLGAKV